MKCVYEVNPFTEIGFRSCFEEAYYPVCVAMNKDVFLMINNHCSYFGMNGKHFFISETLLKSEEEMEKEIFLKREVKGYVKNLDSYIEHELQGKKLVICQVVDLRGTLLGNGNMTEPSSSLHYVLVYGYDNDNRNFLILEHETNISTRYLPCIVSYDALIESNYKSLKKENRGVSLFIFSNAKELYKADTTEEQDLKRKNAYKERMEYNLKNDGYSNLKTYLSLMGTRIDNGFQEEEDVEILTALIRYFKLEYWLQSKVMNIEEENFLLIIKCLNLIRTYCIKYTYTCADSCVMKLKEYSEQLIVYINNWIEETKKLMDDEVMVS